jgi:hypothetical protein
MLNKNEIIEKAYECGFGDIGLHGANQKELLQGVIGIMNGPLEPVWIWWPTRTPNNPPHAKTIIVLMEVYFSQAFLPLWNVISPLLSR